MISVQDLSFSHGVKSIFEKVSFSVSDNSKVALVGPNGAGKTTLLNILIGREIPNAGKVEINGQIGFVPQEIKVDPVLEKSLTIRDYIDSENSYQNHELKQILSGLELEFLDLENSPKKLSGGQKTKLALARALLMQPEILLLDEPTNFMDVSGKKWVMNFLAHYPKTLLLISHDIELLDKAIDKVLFIRTQNKTIEEYSGNYSQFLRLKSEKDALLVRQIKNQQQKIKRLEESVQKARSLSSDKGVRQRVILQRRLERLKQNLPPLPEELKKIKISLPEPLWVGELPVRIVDISKSYGEKEVLNKVTFSVRRGERIALMGPNGSGKSTLLKIMMDLLTPDSGEIIKDEKLKVGYYSQEFETLDMNKTPVEILRELLHIPEYATIPILSRFLFTGNAIYQNLSSFSGGEKTRFAILLLILQDFNLLILDEPTTYLDVLSQRIILEALKQYKGTMIIVSHTEDFIKELEPSRGILLPQNKIDVWSDIFLSYVSTI